MDPRELRIGNYYAVAESEGIFYPTIKELKYNQFGCISSGNHNLELACKPILTTEEWLVMFGLKPQKLIHNDGSITPVTYWVDKNTRLEWYSEKIIGEINTGELMFIYNEKLLKIINYVHQLQNLCFEVTNKELTIIK